MRKLILILTLTSCASSGNIATDAYLYGQSTKMVVDKVGGVWDTYVNVQATKCAHDLPPDTHTKAEFDKCLGPALQHETIVVPALQAYHTAALSLYVALTVHQTSESIAKARGELASALITLLRSVPPATKEIEQIKQLAGM